MYTHKSPKYTQYERNPTKKTHTRGLSENPKETYVDTKRSYIDTKETYVDTKEINEKWVTSLV